MRICSDPVCSALLESRSRKRKSVEHRTAVRTDAVLRDNVVRKWRFGIWVGCGARSPEERIGRAKQRAQIATAHRERWNRVGACAVVTPASPFLGPQEK